MISVSEAETIINQHIRKFAVDEVFLSECYGALLQEDITADRDNPAFNKALMDGIAISFGSWIRHNKSFPITGIQTAGKNPLTLNNHDACIEIMTGAVLPKGSDFIIPAEYYEIVKKKANVNRELDVKKMHNVCLQGDIFRQGEVLLTRGTLLLSPQIAVLASVGKKKVKVSAKGKIAIIATGDELVDIHKSANPYQTRLSNSSALKASLEGTRLFEADMFHIPDNKGCMTSEIKRILKKCDVLILSGGVAMGKLDLVPQVLTRLGVRTLFHKVAQRPGKPFLFGKSKEDRPVFALPGNPVSTQVCHRRYVLPYLRKCLGLADEDETGILSEDFTPLPDLTCFVPVKISMSREGQVLSKPIAMKGSGDYAGLARCDGFMELPHGEKVITKGFVGKIFKWYT